MIFAPIHDPPIPATMDVADANARILWREMPRDVDMNNNFDPSTFLGLALSAALELERFLKRRQA